MTDSRSLDSVLCQLAGASPRGPPIVDSSSENELLDRFVRGLFGYQLDDFKHKRVSYPRCPNCGRRGYCVSACERSVLSTIALRWQYLALKLWSSNVRFTDVRRSGPFKRGRMP